MANETLDQLAAELALGTLEGAEREHALRMLKGDPNFARQVEAWEKCLSPLAEALPQVEPPQHVLAKIELSLDNKEKSLENKSPTEASSQVQTLKNRLMAWRMAAFALGAAAALFAIAVILVTQIPALIKPQNQYVAILRDTKGQEAFVVTFEAPKKRMVIRSLGMLPPPAKSYELWVIYSDGSPATLGLVATSPYVMIKVPDMMDKPKEVQQLKLAVSLENEGGSSKGQPMGPVLFAGKLIRQMP